MKPGGQYSGQRLGIFIDVGNLYHSAKNLHRGRVNYQVLMKHLVGERDLIRAMAYVVKSEQHGTVAPPPQSGPNPPSPEATAGKGGEAAFFDALVGAGFELRSKDLQVFGDGLKKGDWDVGMAVDAIRMGSFLDVIVLVTGDGDFLPLVDYLKWGMGRLVEVAAFRGSVSRKLQESADRFIALEEIPRIIIRK